MPQVARHSGLAADFEAFRTAPAFGPEWLRTARAAAFCRFLERGFPTTRDEEWKFTNVAPIAQIDWKRAGDASTPGDGSTGERPVNSVPLPPPDHGRRAARALP